MDTKLVKQYIIVLLFILNIVLFIFNAVSDDRYTITNSQVKIMDSYLEKNNITLNTKLEKNFLPMSKITMKRTIFNQNDLLEIFFKEELNNNSIELDKVSFNNNFNNEFISNQKSIVVTNNNIFFQDLNKRSGFDYNKNNCIKLANYYATLLSNKYGSLNLDLSFERENYYVFLYTQDNNKFKNFSNNLYVKVYAEGQIELYFCNYDKLEISSQDINIYSIFEALYVFSREVPPLMNGEEIIIQKIDLGYYLKDKGENISLSFEPCYRIFISNSDIPFFINAYTNTFEYDVSFII